MKKNKILFLAFVLTLVLTTIGCTATKPQRPMGTQTRIGLESTDNDLIRRRNTNMMGLERRNNNNLSGVNDRNLSNSLDSDLTTPDNMVRRNTNMGPRTTNNISQKNNLRIGEMSTRAKAIEKKVNNLSEVNNSTVLLNGNTAIVGVNMKNNLQGRISTNLKQKIERTVKNTDNKITNVSITADQDIFTKISNMAKDMENNNPASGFVNEFEKMLKRITPIR